MKRRLTPVVLATLLLAGAVQPSVAAEGRARPRTVTEEYASPAAGYFGGPLGFTYVVHCPSRVGCVPFRKEPGERFVKISVADATGRPIYFNVLLWDRGETREYCATATDVIDVSDIVNDFWVTIPNGTCADGTTPSVATRGTLTAVFAKSRAALRDS